MLMLLLACAPTAPPLATQGELSALTYNVHGLPGAITEDDTAARMRAIAPLLAAFDLVGLQEDFDVENHGLLTAESPHGTHERFDEALPDRYYGSGLATLADPPLLERRDEFFTACNGVLEDSSDCLASKGFMVLRLQLGAGELDVYNSHLEAGGGDDDRAASALQVDQLIAAMNGYSRDRALLFLGDTNLKQSRDEDVSSLDRWLTEAGLEDACDAVDCPQPGRIDRIFYRSGPELHLEVQEWQERLEFVDDDGLGLSDHQAIAALLSWSLKE